MARNTEDHLETLAEVFQCIICMDKLKNAHLCPHCSKPCCYLCITQWLTDRISENQSCPHCRQSLHLNQLIKCGWIEEVTEKLDILQAIGVSNPSHEEGTSRDRPSITLSYTGGPVSSGRGNDKMVDDLLRLGYITSQNVVQAFRRVDRANYFLPSHRETAYMNKAWKCGNIHLSAPNIYGVVLESLSLEPGLSFLNIGSGTGYLSTMAGLILKKCGTNHGIELYEECVDYSYDRLDKFKRKSLTHVDNEFCEPFFMQGNGLNTSLGRQYDRVYCGAACPETHDATIKQFVRTGGILVMPYKNKLLRLTKVDENNWTKREILPVSFATLVIPTVFSNIFIPPHW